MLSINNKIWTKKRNINNNDNTNIGDTFDVTMVGYDDAKICELIGIYIINELTHIITQKDLGL